MLSPNFGSRFDLNRDGKLNARDWGVYRAMMAAENGLLAIKLGGRGDMTETGILWRYKSRFLKSPPHCSMRASSIWSTTAEF